MKPDTQNGIQKSFEATLKNSDLQSVTVDLMEASIDNLFEEGLMKDIPVIGSIVGLARFGANVKDRLFLKKIMYFLSEIKNIPANQRQAMINEIDVSKKHRIKVGEKILYILDSCEDHETSELIGHLFKSFVEGAITYDEFLIASKVISKISIFDFKWFINKSYKYSLDLDEVGDLVGSGLYVLHYEQIRVDVEKETDQKLIARGREYKTDSEGGVDAILSNAGEVILRVFSDK